MQIQEWAKEKGLSGWLAGRLLKFDLFPDYLRAVIKHWNDILWDSTPTFPFIIWWFLGSPPVGIVVGIFVWVLVVAGYYAWRADHEQLMPTLELQFKNEEPFVIMAPEMIGGIINYKQQRLELRKYVRVLPKVVSGTRVTGCTGYLVKVYRLVDGRRVPTAFDESHKLVWSNRESAGPIDLDRGADQFLNIFYIRQLVGEKPQIVPCLESIPTRVSGVFRNAPLETVFQLDVMVTGGGPMSLKVQIRDKWDLPTIEVLPWQK